MKHFFYNIKSKIPARAFVYAQHPYHFFLAFCAAVVYRFPSRKLTIVGVTGTKGKTTVVELINSILEAHGSRVASVSSRRFRIGNEELPNILGMTMPGRFFLQRFFARAVRGGCRYGVIEVTSQGIEQYRHRFISFNVGVLTNIAPEHIEAHGGFEPYLRSKLDFFWRLNGASIAVINREDAQASRVAAACGCDKVWYSREVIEYKKHIWPIRNFNIGSFGIMFDVKGHQIKSSLQGDVNVENILAAIAVALCLRVPFEAISRGIAEVKVIPGRMQVIQNKPFRVIVDYAHTPDSLERAYKSLEKKTNAPRASRLICVLGSAGGGRDVWKRPEFGKIAAAHCRDIIITNEDPFDEAPERIMEDIAAGVRQSVVADEAAAHLRIIADRREAIRHGISLAQSGDTVVITGKGSEVYIRTAHGEKIPWSDAQVVREELRLIPIHNRPVP